MLALIEVRREGEFVGPKVNMFEQVSNDDHQVSAAHS